MKKWNGHKIQNNKTKNNTKSNKTSLPKIIITEFLK